MPPIAAPKTISPRFSSSTRSGYPRRCGLAWSRVGVLGLIVVCGLGASEATDSIAELEAIRDRLQTRVLERQAADAAVAPPQRISLELDRGPGRLGRPLRLELERLAGVWRVSNVVADDLRGLGLVSSVESVNSEATGLDGLKAVLRFQWREAITAEGAAEAEDDDRQREQRLDIAVTPSAAGSDREPRLRLNLERFHGGSDWIWDCRPVAGGWQWERDLSTPRQLAGWGPFGRGELAVTLGAADAVGSPLQLSLGLTYAGEEVRLAEGYSSRGQPRISAEGSLVGTTVTGVWRRQAAGGKHFLGDATNRLSGVLITNRYHGRYSSAGDRGDWSGELRLDQLPVSSGLPPSAPLEASDPLGSGLTLWRQIQALDLAARLHPMTVTDAEHVVGVQPPLATGEAIPAYLAGLVAAARALEAPAAAVPVVDDPWFSPLVIGSEAPVAGNPIPVPATGGQRWRRLGGWQAVGPFPLTSEEPALRSPGLVPLKSLTFARTRVLSDGRDASREDDSPAIWLATVPSDVGLDSLPVHEATAGGLEPALVWYAGSELTAEVETTVQVSLRGAGHCTLWLGDHLVAISDPDPWRARVVSLTIPAGTHRLLVRVASSPTSNRHHDMLRYFDYWVLRPQGRVETMGFAVDVALAGAPGVVLPELQVLAGQERVHADAQPPLAWDLERGRNVAWRSEVPAGDGGLRVWDELILLTAEPDLLLAVGLDDGVERWRLAAGAPADATGPLAVPAPLIIGDLAIAAFGHGTVLAVDRNGQERWRVESGLRWRGHGIGDPIALGGRVILQGHGDKDPYAVVAIEAATGRMLWRCSGAAKPVLVEFDRALGLGNELAGAILRAGEHERHVVVTGDGGVIDASDGRLLFRDIFTIESHRSGPIIVGDTVYAVSVMGVEAVQLALDAEGRVLTRHRWWHRGITGRGRIKANTAWGDRHWIGGPVIDGDRILSAMVDSAHVPQHHPLPWIGVDVFDLDHGRRIERHRGLVRDATDDAVPAMIAGRQLFLVDGGRPKGGFQGTEGIAQVSVVDLDAGLVVLAQSTLPPMHAPLLPIGDRLLARTEAGLMCLRVTDDEGRRSQEQALARALLDRIPPRPAGGESIAISPSSDWEPGDESALQRLLPGQMPTRWLIAGPIPSAEAATSLDGLGGPSRARPRLGDQAGSVSFVALDETHLLRDGDQPPKAIEILGPIGRRPHSAAWYAAALRCERPGSFQVEASGAGVELWLGGRAVADKTVVRLERGVYPILLRCTVGSIPPMARRGIAVSPRLVPVTDPVLERQRWNELIERERPRLQRVLDRLPEDPLAYQARLLLEQAR